MKLKQKDPSTTTVARQSYAKALNTSHASVTQFDIRGKKGNYESGLKPLSVTHGQNRRRKGSESSESLKTVSYTTRDGFGLPNVVWLKEIHTLH